MKSAIRRRCRDRLAARSFFDRLLFCCCFVSFAGSASFAQSPVPKRLLVLYDAGREFNNVQILDQSIEGTLKFTHRERVTLYREYMDLTRINQPDYERILKDFYRQKFASDPPDAIIAVRGRPLDFLLKYGDELFPEVPIISIGMDERQLVVRALPARVTGIALKVEYASTVALALTLRPETKHVAIVIGSSPNDAALEALVRAELGTTTLRVVFDYLAGLTIEQLSSKLASLPANSAVLFVSFARDAAGRSFLPQEAVPRVSRAANAPTFVGSDDVITFGSVGGNAIQFGEIGKGAAKIAIRLFKGERPSSIPFTQHTARRTIIEASEARRWKIPANRIPPGALVLNRVPSVWEAYRWQIVAAVAVILSQSGLIVALLVHRKRRRTAERNLVTSEARKQTAVMEERTRMARDIHDTLAQGITGVILQLRAATKAFADASPDQAHQHLRRAEDTARESLGEARRSIHALRPGALERGALSVVLPLLADQMTAGTKVRADFKIEGEPHALPAAIEDNLLRIQQEILANVLKHSDATLISGTLSFRENGVRLEVNDNGVGIDPSTRGEGYGLLGIRERVTQMNGSLSIKSSRGNGTHICVILDGAAAKGAVVKT